MNANAKAVAVGSKAKTLSGMVRAIRTTLTPRPFPDPYGRRAWGKGDRRRERIIRKAADPTCQRRAILARHSR
jgi:hypothetical protein